MSAEQPPAITDADVRSLAAKLKGLHALLTPAEQELLRLILERAAQREAMATGDAEGFVWGVSFNPFTFLDAIDFDALADPGAGRRTPRQTTSDPEGRPS